MSAMECRLSGNPHATGECVRCWGLSMRRSGWLKRWRGTGARRPVAVYSATDSWHAHEIAIPTSYREAPASCILTLAADPTVATMISADQPTVVVMKSCQELCADEFSGDH
jgi:hypothetical protein